MSTERRFTAPFSDSSSAQSRVTLAAGHDDDARAQVCGGKDSSAAGAACSFPPRWQLGAPVLGFACNVHAIWALDRQLEDGHSVTLVKLARSSSARGLTNADHNHKNNHIQETTP